MICIVCDRPASSYCSDCEALLCRWHIKMLDGMTLCSADYEKRRGRR